MHSWNRQQLFCPIISDSQLVLFPDRFRFGALGGRRRPAVHHPRTDPETDQPLQRGRLLQLRLRGRRRNIQNRIEIPERRSLRQIRLRRRPRQTARNRIRRQPKGFRACRNRGHRRPTDSHQQLPSEAVGAERGGRRPVQGGPQCVLQERPLQRGSAEVVLPAARVQLEVRPVLLSAAAAAVVSAAVLSAAVLQAALLPAAVLPAARPFLQTPNAV